MTCLIFRTPGSIDLRAFTLMGASAKLDSNPIGRFGTGLKYSVASLCRWGSPPELFIGRHRFEFKIRQSQFRGKAVDELSIRRGLVRRTLPYTTNYGRDWQPWMVVRELEANTRDEGGQSFLAESAEPQRGSTQIVVRDPRCIAAWQSLHEIFLVGGRRTGSGCQVIESPSSFIYWRGMKVLELPKPAQRTYNILDDIYLTEDRTIYGFQAEAAIAKWTVREADIPQIKQVITAKDEHWEHKINLDSTYEPSEAFHECMTLQPKGIRESVHSYYAPYKPQPVSRLGGGRQPTLGEIHPTPWNVVGSSVRDANSRVVFDQPEGYVGDWAMTARLILAHMSRISGQPKVELEVQF